MNYQSFQSAACRRRELRVGPDHDPAIVKVWLIEYVGLTANCPILGTVAVEKAQIRPKPFPSD
jgi:hypothetical protein